ncbi:hypothetical protein DFP72DRAFT_1071248 [Ephemerocybe angulata]|uniref:Uncharacterized protein n=1 Tax=Ephemerocybe angulata TaxID=980116 RepID=A0A8H6HRT1_9AGAR|nr:hypothetical protein DFP72DRAFT_1071248 [Tulosesus angulatus]
MSIPARLKPIFNKMDQMGVTASEIMIFTLEYSGGTPLPAAARLQDNTEMVLDRLCASPVTALGTRTWAISLVTSIYKTEVQNIVHRDSGFHMTAKFMTEEKLTAFDVQEFADKISSSAPTVWKLFDSSDSTNYQREWA